MQLLNLRAKKGVSKSRKRPRLTLDEAFEKMRIFIPVAIEVVKICKLIIWAIDRFFN